MNLSETWTTGTVSTDDVDLQYYRPGDGPPVLMAHGMYDSGRRWRHWARIVAAGQYDVGRADARGHGHSDAPETGTTSKPESQTRRGRERTGPRPTRFSSGDRWALRRRVGGCRPSRPPAGPGSRGALPVPRGPGSATEKARGEPVSGPWTRVENGVALSIEERNGWRSTTMTANTIPSTSGGWPRRSTSVSPTSRSVARETPTGETGFRRIPSPSVVRDRRLVDVNTG